MSSSSTDERIKSALNDLGLMSSFSSLAEIPGDLSPRRYYRCMLNEVNIKIHSNTLMVMVFDSIIPPESEAKLVYTSDVSFLELASFFDKNQIPVPKIFLDRRDIGVILLEDLGSDTLINILKSQPNLAFQYYAQACEIIKTIQNIPIDNQFFAFNRALELSVFKRETESFKKYFLDGDLSEGHRKQLEECIDLVCEEVAGFKQVLVHRDFHSWNLMIDSEKRLRVIDFQDALMGPRAYDLVALLHERDIDYALTNEQILKLEDEYFSAYQDPEVRNYEYPRVQLQRDIKTTGLFKRCVVERNLPSYGTWIPGNIKRMKCTLSGIVKSDPRYKVLYDFVIGMG